jgi:hypothetical protein
VKVTTGQALGAVVLVETVLLIVVIAVWQSSVSQDAPPQVFIRTFGNALGAYVEHGGVRYFRLTQTGPASGIEAVLGQSFDTSVVGNAIEWRAVANNFSAYGNRSFYPMGLENSPHGSEGLVFEDHLGLQMIAVSDHGLRVNRSAVSWNPLAVNDFKIVIVSPGDRADFYINGTLVGWFSHIPEPTFTIAFAEIWCPVQVLCEAQHNGSIATLDAFGGSLG